MIVGALLCRNEGGEDRYLRRAVEDAKSFCDRVLAVDDNSTDNTVDILQDLGVEVVRHRRFGDPRNGFWGRNETAFRARLWHEAAQRGDWVYFFDADHELMGITPEDFRLLCQSKIANAWSFPLWDCWGSDTFMRVDGYWQAHLHPRAWLFSTHPIPDWEPEWDEYAIHAGHMPGNYPLIPAVAPGLAGIRHLGYVQEAHRVAKHQQYTQLKMLTPSERAHAESIMDEKVILAPIPSEQQPKVLIASVVRKPPEVVEAFLQTLKWQEAKADTDICLLGNFAPGEVYDPGLYEKVIEAPVDDYGEGQMTRQWMPPAFARMAAMKDALIDKAMVEGYDYIWLVDADVMCDPFTLQSLLDNDATIVSAVYWTNWQRPELKSSTFVHAGPQVWLRHPYLLDDGNYTEQDFRAALIGRSRIQVGGLGACTLIRSDVMEKGVRFKKEFDLPAGPMSEGEDRHFCVNARRKHVGLVADAWPDIWHAYHPTDYGQLPERLRELGEWPHLKRPRFGDLVSITVQQLEPVTDPKGQMFHISAKYVRGKLGALPVMPQIEEKVASLTRGESALLRVHFPAHYEVESLRSQTRVMRIELLDCKPFRFAPIIETELFQGEYRYLDSTDLTGDQVRAMKEDSREQ